MNTRRSCRRFLNKPVPKEKLDYILDTVKNSPTGCNYQPLDIFVIEDAALLKELNDISGARIKESFGDGIKNLMDTICTGWNQEEPLSYGSTCVLVFIQDKRRKEVTVREDAGVMACSAALAAQEKGLKTVIVGMVKFVGAEILKAFDLSAEEWEVHLAVPIGEPDEKYVDLKKEDLIKVHRK